METYVGYYHSPIGLVEIMTTDDAVLSATFVEQEADRQDTVEILERAIQQFDEYFKGVRKDFDLPCHVEGTEFQKNAWNALRKIPYGETKSYKQQAILIGNEKATRAIGNANSKNKISIVIPCHRVVGSNKSLTGYAGGINRKKWLLAHEQGVLAK
ncbi:methylated-DNA--[protein]-cysteine S-methyltransferase [Bacillus weihaiensis]|uniref:methylated-DNA--[protein]-cysteine S-methyltransferase n=1 Tax=Bacillus weihaiensis TaxID=1547283 RepID=UPI003F6B4E46